MGLEKTIQKKRKIVYLELLRIIACFCVIINHTNSGIFLSRTPDSKIWWVSLTYFFVSKTAVPIFLMISGVLLLGHVDTYRKWSSRMLHIFLDILIFSFFYYVWSMYTADRSVNLIEYLKLIWQRNVTNAYWYLYLYLGILLMLPLFQRLSVNMGKREYELLILVCAVFMSTMPIVIHYMPGAAFSSYFCDPFFSEFVGIFFLGYYIHNYVPVKKEYALAAVLVFGMDILLQVLLTYREYQVDPQQYLFFDERTFITVVIAAATLFYLGRCMEAVLTSEWFWKVVGFFGGCSFGIYLLSDFFLDSYYGIYGNLSERMNPMIAVFFYECLIFLTGAAVTAVLKKIPYIKKLL